MVDGTFMLNCRIASVASAALRWLLGGSFVWAGAIKLADPKSFARTVDAFGLVPETLLIPLAFILPMTEILIGIAVWRRWRGGLPAMAGLLAAFLAVLGYAIGQNLDVDCGCFSVSEQATHTSIKTAFARDLAMLGGIACLGLLTRAGRSSETSSRPGAVRSLPEREDS